MSLGDAWAFPVLNRKDKESLESLTEQRTTLHGEATANSTKLAVDVYNAYSELQARAINNRYGAAKSRIKTERMLLDQKILVSMLWDENDYLREMVYGPKKDGKKRCFDGHNPLAAPPYNATPVDPINGAPRPQPSSSAAPLPKPSTAAVDLFAAITVVENAILSGKLSPAAALPTYSAAYTAFCNNPLAAPPYNATPVNLTNGAPRPRPSSSTASLSAQTYSTAHTAWCNN
jgi:hypothetical protein